MSTPVQLTAHSKDNEGTLVTLPRACGYLKVTNTDAALFGWVGFRDVNNGDNIVPSAPNTPPLPPTSEYTTGYFYVKPGGYIEYDWFKSKVGDLDPTGSKMTHIMLYTADPVIFSILGI